MTTSSQPSPERETLLTKARAAARLELDRRLRARTRLIDFTRYTYPRYDAAPHHELIASALDRVVEGIAKRVMIFAPPRHGKSELTSRKLPPYFLGRHPDRQVIATAYGDELVTEFGRDVRNLVQSPQYRALFPAVKLADDSQAKDRWNVAGKRGAYVASGVGGGITGKGAHLAIIDDPVKDRKAAESPTQREAVWSWYRSVLYTRLEEEAAIVLTLTRWHEDDLAGKILMEEANGGERWEKLHLAPIDSGDGLATWERMGDDGKWEKLRLLKVGAGVALWEKKYPARVMSQIRRTLGEYEWSALYGGTPRPLEGGYFSERDFLVEAPGQDGVAPERRAMIPVDVPKHITLVFAIIDSAMKTGAGRDGLATVYFAYSKFFDANAPAGAPGREGRSSLTVLDWDVTQVDAAFLINWVPSVFARLEQLAVETRALQGSVGAYVEDKASGIVLNQQTANLELPTHPIDSKLSSLGKVERGLDISIYVKGGQVKMTKLAHEKVVEYKGRTRNHLLAQALDFRPSTEDMGEDDLFDGLCYGVALGLGNGAGF